MSMPSYTYTHIDMLFQTINRAVKMMKANLLGNSLADSQIILMASFEYLKKKTQILLGTVCISFLDYHIHES